MVGRREIEPPHAAPNCRSAIHIHYTTRHCTHRLALFATVAHDAAAVALALGVRRVAVAAAVHGLVVLGLAVGLSLALALALALAALLGSLAIAAAVVWVGRLVLAGVVRGGTGLLCRALAGAEAQLASGRS